MQQGRFRREDMIIHHPGAQPYGYVPTLVTRGVDQFCLAGMVCFWKALKIYSKVGDPHSLNNAAQRICRVGRGDFTPSPSRNRA